VVWEGRSREAAPYPDWRVGPDIEGMSSTVLQIAAVVAGLLILTSYVASAVILRRSVAISLGTAVLAAVPLTVLRHFVAVSRIANMTTPTAVLIRRAAWVGSRPKAERQSLTMRVTFQNDPLRPLDLRTKKEQCSLYVLQNHGETDMLRIFVEEAAALTSITLFVGMIAVWAQLISQF
jgi:hypothetical protein